MFDSVKFRNHCITPSEYTATSLQLLMITDKSINENKFAIQQLYRILSSNVSYRVEEKCTDIPHILSQTHASPFSCDRCYTFLQAHRWKQTYYIYLRTSHVHSKGLFIHVYRLIQNKDSFLLFT